MTIIAIGGVLKKGNKYLLVQEAKADFKGKWNLPAGRLEPRETIFEGAKREIAEECGYHVDLTGIAEIRNDATTDNAFIGIIFSTKIIGENADYNNHEILNTKWFSHDEILEMHDELRYYDGIVGAISAVEKNNILSIDTIKA